ncbi:MAG: hypothetical protein ACYTG5_03035 [Planctomycetota bacterium]|jgi:hypothetical protein
MKAIALISSLLVLPLASLSQDNKPLPLEEPAPAFSLNDHHGKKVTVGGEADHWTVLAFYPMAGTPG